MPATEPDRRTGRLALAVLVGACLIRIIAAIIAGFISLGRHDQLNVGRLHAGEVLDAFGSAGESVGALLAVTTAAMVWWLSRESAVSRGAVRLVRAVVVLTAVLVVTRAVGVLIIELDNDHVANELAIVVGFAVADLLLCMGGLLALSGVRPATLEELDPDEIEPLLFAVDRGNGEVFAFFSFAQARRTISSYSVEEDEYDFFTDEGLVVAASAADTVTRFTPTDVDRRADLMQALRQFALAKELTVEDPQDPTAYAVPIADWQWLELWPGWLRPIGRLVRRLQA